MCQHWNTLPWGELRRALVPLLSHKFPAQCMVCDVPRAGLWLCVECMRDPDQSVFSLFFCCSHHRGTHCHSVYLSLGKQRMYCKVCEVEEESSLSASILLSDLSKMPAHLVLGQAGLVNLGKTCYMNVVLQCLNQIPALSRFFISLPSAEAP